MKNLTRLFLVISALQLSACGTGDPLSFMDTPFPPLNAIAAFSGSATLSYPYTVASPSWQFLYSNLTGGSYLAPAAGYVSSIGTVLGAGSSMTIVHSGRLATTLSGLQTISARQGDVVSAGQVVGTYYNGGGAVYVTFQVLVDGTPVCPLSYMSTQFRQFFSSYTPCQ